MEALYKQCVERADVLLIALDNYIQVRNPRTRWALDRSKQQYDSVRMRVKEAQAAEKRPSRPRMAGGLAFP